MNERENDRERDRQIEMKMHPCYTVFNSKILFYLI